MTNQSESGQPFFSILCSHSSTSLYYMIEGLKANHLIREKSGGQMWMWVWLLRFEWCYCSEVGSIAVIKPCYYKESKYKLPGKKLFDQKSYCNLKMFGPLHIVSCTSFSPSRFLWMIIIASTKENIWVFSSMLCNSNLTLI